MKTASTKATKSTTMGTADAKANTASNTSKRTRFRLIRDELTAVMLWITSVTWLFFATSTPLLHTLLPSLQTVNSQHVFLFLLALTMGIWEFFGLSLGSAFNPAVTFSHLLTGKIAAVEWLFMTVCQFTGTLAAVYSVRTVATSLFAVHVVSKGAGASVSASAGASAATVFAPPVPHASVPWVQAIAIEAAITAGVCFLSLSLNSVVDPKAEFRKWYISSSVIVALMAMASEWTGSCMNPAVSFALSYMEEAWDMHSVYWLGPYLGAILAAAFHVFVIEKRARPVACDEAADRSEDAEKEKEQEQAHNKKRE